MSSGEARATSPMVSTPDECSLRAVAGPTYRRSPAGAGHTTSR